MNPQRNPLEITGRHLVYFVAGACAALGVLAASAARSQTAPVRLKPIVTVEADVVRLSDLIDGSGADIAVFGAPAPGGTGQISTARIVAAAREHGVTGVETRASPRSRSAARAGASPRTRFPRPSPPR